MRKIRLRRTLPGDTKAESVMYAFVLLLSFVGLMVVAIAGVTQYVQAGASNEDLYGNLVFPFNMTEYMTIEADEEDDRYYDAGGGLHGYNVSTDDILDYVPYPTDEDPFKFWKPDEPDEIKYVHIIRDNQDYDPGSTDMWRKYRDFIAVRRDTGNVIGERWNGAAIPFAQIADNWGNDTNASATNFFLSRSQDTLFINSSASDAANFTDDLYDNDFHLFYGWARFRLQEIDFWNAISMLFYNDIPEVDPLVNNLIHIMMISTTVFVIFTMAIRMTPFLGGA